MHNFETTGRTPPSELPPPVAAHSPAYYADKELLTYEQESLLGKLRARGVTQVKTALEIEFVPDEAAPPDSGARLPDGRHYWEARKQAILDEYAQRIASARDVPAQATLQQEAALIRDVFGPRETLYYDLVHDKEVAGLLVPQSRVLSYDPVKKKTSYEDARGVFEIRMRPMDARKLERAHATVVNTLEHLLARYDLQKNENYTYHYNFSLWQGDKNLNDPCQPEFKTVTPHIMQGVARALHEAEPALYTKEEMKAERLPSFTLGPARLQSLRVVGEGELGRAELRLSDDNHLHNFTLLNVLVMAGALHGLKQAQAEAPGPAEVAVRRKAVFRAKSEDAFPIAHVLGGMTVRDDGSVIVPAPYLRNIEEKLPVFARSLGLISGTARRLSVSEQGRLTGKIFELFNGVHIEDSGGKARLRWPKVKGIADDRLAALSAQIESVGGLMPTLELSPGFPSTTRSLTPGDRIGERVLHMENNTALCEGCSREFLDDMRAALRALLGDPSVTAEKNYSKYAHPPAHYRAPDSVVSRT